MVQKTALKRKTRRKASKLVRNDPTYKRTVDKEMEQVLDDPIPQVSQIKEIMFSHEYLTDLDAVGAGIRSGMIDMRASTKQQEEQSKAILLRPNVQLELYKAVENRVARTQVTEDRVIRELANVAFFDRGELYNDEGELIPINELPASARACIAEVEHKIKYNHHNAKEKVMQHSITRYRTYDKIPSLKLLLQHL